MTAHSLPRRRVRATAAVLVTGALGLTLTACGSSSGSTASGPAKQNSQGGTKLAAVWPLTGLPMNGSAPNRPIVAVKIPNTPEANPQTGMGKADMVTEELVEGGITRLAVFFYSQVPPIAGPVRSMRASDIGIVRPLHATIVSSGAAPPTLRRLTQAHVPFYTGGPGYYRDGARIAPYNLLVHLPDLVRTLKKPKAAPAPYLQWGKESDFAGKKKARSIAVRFSGYRTSQWVYRGGSYVNTNSYEPAGDSFRPATVLVLRVREGNAGYLDPAGNPVPETILTGGGPAMIFHAGRVETVTWHKAGVDAPLILKDKAGKAVKVPAGKVMTELDPANRFNGSVTFSKR